MAFGECENNGSGGTPPHMYFFGGCDCASEIIDI